MMWLDLIEVFIVGVVAGGFIVYEWLDSSGKLKDKR